jgi:hypothetical protein
MLVGAAKLLIAYFVRKSPCKGCDSASLGHQSAVEASKNARRRQSGREAVSRPLKCERP